MNIFRKSKKKKASIDTIKEEEKLSEQAQLLQQLKQLTEQIQVLNAKPSIEPYLKSVCSHLNGLKNSVDNINAELTTLKANKPELGVISHHLESLKNSVTNIDTELKNDRLRQAQLETNGEKHVDNVISVIEDIIPKKKRKQIKKRFSRIKQQAQAGRQNSISEPTKTENLIKNTPPHLITSFGEALNHQAPKEHKKTKVTLAPGSCGEHELQEKNETKPRALNFYNKQVLDYLAPKMQEFVLEQEFLFISTSDSQGECDCTSKFGEAGFIRVLNEKYVIYPEYRGNGVMANLGNITENPHIALLMIDFQKSTMGLHINGKAKILENDELLEYGDKLPESIAKETQGEGKKRPERWVMVEIEEAYIQCSKHIPLMKKMDKHIEWGTDNVAAKGGDFFELKNIPLFDRVGGDKGMEIVVDQFYRKVLKDDFVAPFFEDVDMDAQRQKQKAFLSMAFGGPYQYGSTDLRKAHQRLVDKMKMGDKHFEHVLKLLAETLRELDIPDKPIEEILATLESTREDVLCR